MKRILWALCGTLVLVAGTLIYLYPDFRTWRMQNRVTELESALENNTTCPYPDLYEAFVEYNNSLLVEEQNITDAWEYEQPPFDLSAYGYHESAIGVLKIPDMDLTMPLYLGANYEHMADGAAVLSRTSMPIGGENTNCVIAGHRGWGGSPYFANIENLTKGSYVFIKNPWEELAYEVTEIRIMHKSETDAVLIRKGDARGAEKNEESCKNQSNRGCIGNGRKRPVGTRRERVTNPDRNGKAFPKSDSSYHNPSGASGHSGSKEKRKQEKKFLFMF